jgi:hypothetical protein
MNTDGWHASEDMLRGYARGEGGIAMTASVEAHLMHCPVCRDRLAIEVTEPPEGVWARVADQIALPPAPATVRALRRFGLSETDAVLLSAARSLSGAWLLATIAVVAFSALAAIPGIPQGQGLYLLVAPLVPVLGVVAAFGSADPLAGLTATTPYSKARLALLRTAAVVVASVPLSVAIGVVTPGIAWLAFAWLLPSLALTLITLVMMSWWDPEPVGITVAAAWLGAIGAGYATHDVSAAVRVDLQLVYLAVALLAGVALTFRLGSPGTKGGYA